MHIHNSWMYLKSTNKDEPLRTKIRWHHDYALQPSSVCLRNFSMYSKSLFGIGFRIHSWIDRFVLSCGMPFPRSDAINKHDISFQRTFCRLRVDVHYESLCEKRLRSNNASSSLCVGYCILCLNGTDIKIELLPYIHVHVCPELRSTCIWLEMGDTVSWSKPINFSDTTQFFLDSSYIYCVW